MAVQSELLYALETPDGSRRYAEAESLDAILVAAATLREDGEDVDAMVVLRSGVYDAATTALVQDGLV